MATARLYLVIEATPGGQGAAWIVERALAGGTDVVQLREKSGDEALIRRVGTGLLELCRAAGALFIVNDRPDLAVELDADGVHVGQEDLPVQEARAVVGADRLIGLSTHSPEQLARARGVDQVSVGPVWETPTKPGRPAAGLELVSHAAAHPPEAPWFAIGGIEPDNVDRVVDAGASRIVVARAIRDAEDPEAAARTLRGRLEAADRSPA